MKSKWTEGPWNVIEPLYDDEKEVYVGIKAKRMGRTDYHVCKMLGHGSDYDNDPEQQANARLIASAPTLYTTLQEVLQALETHIQADVAKAMSTTHTLPIVTVKTVCPCWNEVVEKARALLAELEVQP